MNSTSFLAHGSRIDHTCRSRKKLETPGTTKFDAVYEAEASEPYLISILVPSSAMETMLTPNSVGSYKPDLRNFQYAFDHLKADFGIEKHEILSVANSKFHDVEP